MPVVFDIETDGLKLTEITQIHCICCYDTDTHEELVFFGNDERTKTTIQNGVDYLLAMSGSAGTGICGHNIVDYDIPVIKKFFPEFDPLQVTDTLILARMAEPDRLQGHSLKSYGPMFGAEKVVHEDWTTFSPEMLNRCQVDVQINARLYDYLQEKLKDPLWKKSIQLEHQVAKVTHKQAQYGWLFDTKKANRLLSHLEDGLNKVDKDIGPLLSTKCKQIAFINKPFKKNGDESVQSLNYGIADVVGSYNVIEFVQPNLASQKQLKELLLSLGWKPTEWNYKTDKKKKKEKDDKGHHIKTSPILTEDSYDSIPPGLGQQIALRCKICHRFNLVTGLIAAVREDGRIPAEVTSVGTPTARMRHRIVTNIPKADKRVLLGKQIRSLFTVGEGKVLVGVDAKALEARCLAHYVNDPIFTESILTSDIHTTMKNLANLETRDQAKPLTYGLIYGAGDAKLGRIINGTATQGLRLRNELYRACPGIERLIEGCKDKAKQFGFIKGIDDRRLFTRSYHSSLNLLLQAAGSIIIKTAMCILDSRITNSRLDCHQVGVFHDEFQLECNIKDVDSLKILIKDTAEVTTKYLKLRCPLEFDIKLGQNWSETH
jgi:DNA polymerase-1